MEYFFFPLDIFSTTKRTSLHRNIHTHALTILYIINVLLSCNNRICCSIVIVVISFAFNFPFTCYKYIDFSLSLSPSVYMLAREKIQAIIIQDFQHCSFMFNEILCFPPAAVKFECTRLSYSRVFFILPNTDLFYD